MDATKPVAPRRSRAADAFYFILLSCGALFIIHPTDTVLTYTALSIIGLFLVFTPIIIGGFGLHTLVSHLR